MVDDLVKVNSSEPLSTTVNQSIYVAFFVLTMVDSGSLCTLFWLSCFRRIFIIKFWTKVVVDIRLTLLHSWNDTFILFNFSIFRICTFWNFEISKNQNLIFCIFVLENFKIPKIQNLQCQHFKISKLQNLKKSKLKKIEIYKFKNFEILNIINLNISKHHNFKNK